MRTSLSRLVGVFLLAVVVTFGFPKCSKAITFLTPPTFTPATNAPLAGQLQINTDVDSRVSALVSDGTGIWERDFYDFATNHTVPLLGFKPGQTNLIQVTVYDKNRNANTSPQLLTFITSPLPTHFTPCKVLTNSPDQMEPGYTLFTLVNRDFNSNYVTIVDNSGAVVWYNGPWPSADVDVKQMDNGDLFFVDAASNRFLEINLLGNVVHTWNGAAGYPINAHDGVPTEHGTILYLSDQRETVQNFPTSDTIPNPSLTTATIDDCPIIEISATNDTLLNTWSPLTMLDPTRVTYLTYGPYSGSPYGTDNEHANAVIENTNENSLIVSLRNQNAVFSFTRAGQLKWILGPPALWSTAFVPYLLTPVGTPFEWNYGQHGPMLTPEGTLVLYDDGIERASPYASIVPDQNNYSRAVEYAIDETNMTVNQVWDTSITTNQDRFFTPIVGKTDWLPKTRNILVTYGYITYLNGAHPSSYSAGATMARLIEYTHDPVPQVVFDLSIFDYTNTSATYLGNWVYRCHRIPDMYAHPAESVADLAINNEYGVPLLEFSADPNGSYLVQGSDDLVNWTTLGTPVPDEGVGEYYFEDLNADQSATRFYRVVTQ